MSPFPDAFRQLLADSVGDVRAGLVTEALHKEASVSIRLNPARLTACPFPDAVPVAWSPHAYLLKERPVFTLDPLFHAGCYYVQDSSAMYAGHVFRRVGKDLQAGATVLDLCAAPGGKTTDLAASLRERFGDEFTLLANEVMHSRFNTLRSNVESWGDPCIGITSRDPSAFGDTPLFDLILADVPCSGEGMFRKDPRAVAEWSPETVQFCAARSRRILSAVWPVLKPGGMLLYATCTFNRFENDDTVAWVASELGADILPPEAEAPVLNTRHGALLLPGLVPGEGQYVAALRKHGRYEPGQRADVVSLFRALRPAAAPPDAPRWEADRETALRYLHGDALQLPPDAPVGPLLLCYRGQVLGPAKNLGKRCNNLYPKHKRIRMDIR